MVREIVMSNFAIWMLIVSLFVTIIGNFNFDRKINGLFLSFIGIVSLLDVADIMDYYFQSLETLNYWRYVSSSVGYILRPGSLVIVLLVLFRREKKGKFLWALWLPIALEALIVISSPWTKWVFSFTESNHFIRGPIGFLPHIMSGVYFGALLFLTFLYSRQIDKVEVVTVLLIGVFAFVATIVESLTDYKFLGPAAMIVSCSSYYLYFHFRSSRVDIMTGLYNRQFFYFDTDMIKRKSAVIISADLNGLKIINDTYGHDRGDEALTKVGSCLTKASGGHYRVYRTGGDEFIAIGQEKSLKDGQEYIEKVKKLLSSTPYMASFGLSFYDGKSDLNKALKVSDEAMYKDKNRYSHR